LTNNIKALDFNGVKILFDNNTRLINLQKPQALPTESMRDITSGDSYQVPVGKKARVIFGAMVMGSATGLIYADNEDGITNQVVLIDGTGAPNFTNQIIITDEIPASKWINSVSDIAARAWSFTVVEEAA